MPNRTEARPAKAVLTYATGRLPLLRLFSTPLIIPLDAGNPRAAGVERKFVVTQAPKVSTPAKTASPEARAHTCARGGLCLSQNSSMTMLVP